MHLSAGDLLREERNTPGSAVGELIENHIRNGTIVPVEITCSLLAKVWRMAEGYTKLSLNWLNWNIQAMEKSGKGKFLIDGFPRNKDNLDGWQREMGDKTKVEFVLFFDCSQEVTYNSTSIIKK